MSFLPFVSRFRVRFRSVACAAIVIASAVACSSSSPGASPASSDGGVSGGDGGSLGDGSFAGDGASGDGALACSSPGGPTPGAADMHCLGPDGGAIVQATNLADCNPNADALAGLPPPGTTSDASLPCYEGNGEFGPTMYGTSGADDDCKYDITWSSAPATFCAGTPVAFTVKASARASGQPVTGAGAILEVTTADCNHAPPGRLPDSVEGPPGTYTFGPIAFDKSGQWLVRFHFFEYDDGGSCDDQLPTSPHGHAAFWITVP